jgi:glycosyltransferase involved in cell wall biosynthesis
MDLMETIFWFSIGAIFYAYLGYPLVLNFIPRKRIDGVDNSIVFMPTVSIIIPAHNEERVIEEKIQNTLILDYPKDRIEIILVSDGSQDRTNEIAMSYQDKGLMFYALSERKGKAAALNLGLTKVTNEIVVFSDSSIMLHSDALRKLVRRFVADDIGCVSGEDYIPGGGGEGLYGKYELFLRNLESKTASIVGASGSFYAQRKNLCESFKEGMAPDFLSVLQTVRKGFRAITEPEARGSMKSVPEPHRELQRKVRTFVRGITTLMNFGDMLNPFRYGVFALQLISHKVMRWLVGLFLITLFVSNMLLLGSNFYLLCFVAQLVFYI